MDGTRATRERRQAYKKESVCGSRAVRDQQEDQLNDGEIVLKVTLEEQSFQSMNIPQEQEAWHTESHCRA